MMSLGLAKLSTALAQQQVKQEATMSVKKMAMDTAKDIGEQMVDILDEFSEGMQKSIDTHRGQHVNLLG